MGILTRRRMAKYEAAIQAAQVIDPSAYPIASPWSTSTLQRIVAEDVFGTDLPVNTRSGAMRIPAVARSRNLMVSSISGNPLVSMRKTGPVDPQPTWLTAAAGGTSPQQRIAWTVDDLIFYGWSCWWRDNGADGFPVAATRIPISDWSIDADNQVIVNGVPVRPDQVIVIPGLHEGVLTFGVDALRDTTQLYANVRKRLANPVPALDLHQTGGRELTDDEIDALIDRWAVARQGANGGVSYTSQNIEAKPMGGADDSQLMIESRNAAAVDIARMIGISAGLIDATTPKSSLNYETTQGRNEEFIDRDLALYMAPIVWRLSLDDVTPRGQYVAFDTSAFTGPFNPTGPALED